MPNEKVLNYPKYGKVLDIYLSSVEIVITYEKKIMKILAVGDCCSYSWFEYPDDMKKFIGYKILNIVNTKKKIDLPVSNIQEYDENMICYIYTDKRKKPYMFYLRNSSNGYYSGWFEIELENRK